jgi:hypothetical protein
MAEPQLEGRPAPTGYLKAGNNKERVRVEPGPLTSCESLFVSY